ncbi:hypothetical protein DFQ30_007153 [Apophysomyces sp. BC1015]|nr:hypothetical protein DFQ30_007153 [Apophysomyces sp. BC1015]KAG0181903.1 hypothetical protein DFQ29_006569 [Apophysomyces sp. BC1021]
MAGTDTKTSTEQSGSDFIVDHDEPDSTATPPSSPEPDFDFDTEVADSSKQQEFEQDYRHDTTFLLDISAEASQPGLLKGEYCPSSDVMNNSYSYLRTNFPHWRRMLSHDYMRNTDTSDNGSPITEVNPAQLVLLHIDDHAWASVDHYIQASKFALLPEVYAKFTLDSGNPLGRSPAADARRFGRKAELGDDQIKAWQAQRPQTLKRALLAKFAQNEDLGRALVATGWAKLVTRGRTGTIKTQHALMWVRKVLRGEQENQLRKSATDKPVEDKHVDEVFRLIEGLFGKDFREMAQPAVQTTSTTRSSPLTPSIKTPENQASPREPQMQDAVSYLEQIKSDYAEDPKTFDKFLGIMEDFRSER